MKIVRTRPLTPGAREALRNAELAVRYDPVATEAVSLRRQRGRVFAQCLRLAPDLETFEALLRDDEVPISRLDPYWVERYGLREGQGVGGG